MGDVSNGARGVGEIPQPHGVIVVAGGQGVPVGAKRHTFHTFHGAGVAGLSNALRFSGHSLLTTCFIHARA